MNFNSCMVTRLEERQGLWKGEFCSSSLEFQRMRDFLGTPSSYYVSRLPKKGDSESTWPAFFLNVPSCWEAARKANGRYEA